MDVGLSNSTINTGQRSTSIVIVGALRGACFTPGSSRSRATYHGPERVKPVTLSEQDLRTAGFYSVGASIVRLQGAPESLRRSPAPGHSLIPDSPVALLRRIADVSAVPAR